MDQAVIDKMNDILRHEWTGVAQYSQAGFVVTGLMREVYADMFLDSAKESFGHAKKIGEKISALGGVPTVERNPVKQSTDLVELLEIGLEFESKAVALYTEVLKMVDGKNRPLVILLEDILLEEQEGVDHLSLILKDHAGSSVSSKSTSKVG
ncbi:ferritin-like domain-containing protein [Blastopirellula sp. JC732]|uniref:Ferritin-like domain-containing protein n=1 Tax=Blastopirellula sediminis TaxID=2894196 RepID=A0A9X1MS88_9BACT|nr:ferritin-like domain-containing protein [Blastopirellula sediminis]MCC9605071.1 ferritin-like domain-containing protein [Blastopirellula sediminis]MCC9631629.1 ferritin-like domain-containing protein [Blastopirellula sediminis]